MDLNLRLAALSQLAASGAVEARERLVKELARIEISLREETDFEKLAAALKTLRVIAANVSVPAIAALLAVARSLPTRRLTHGDEPQSQYLVKHRGSSSLMREVIDTSMAVRYLETEGVIQLLLDLARNSEEDVSKKALQAMEDFAEFDLEVFYGDERSPGLGAQPQARIVAYFGTLSNPELLLNCVAILRTLSKVMSPSMRGTSWTYDTVTLSRGETPPVDGVAAVRAAAIELTIRMYSLDSAVAYRRTVVRELNGATRRENVGERDAKASAMFVRDTITVLQFFKSLVGVEALPLVQVIEHDTYWIFHHTATVEVERAALQIRDDLSHHVEYIIYKTLIGFEGIFGDWEKLKRSEEEQDFSDDNRKAAAERYVEEIGPTTSAEWRNRILKFSETESDDLATFPVYYFFLQTLATKKAAFALQLLSEDTEKMARFLIPLLHGLWESEESSTTEGKAARWIVEGRYLQQIAKSLYGTAGRRIDILASVIKRAADLDDRWALIVAMGVSASLYAEGAKAGAPMFLSVLRELTKREDARWASNIWHNRDFRLIVRELAPSERAELLAGLRFLDKVDYQSEEILFAIAQHDAVGVLAYLVNRLRHERERRQTRDKSEGESYDSKYEAIPYRLHKLNEPLSKIPDEVIHAMRENFSEEDSAMFSYRGARLLKAIFPVFGPELESRLTYLVKNGNPEDVTFALSILRTYEGSSAIQSVCKAIVMAVPERSKFWNEVAVAIENTGVVRGEYGFSNAYVQKKAEIGAWMDDPDARVRAFAQWLIEGLDQMIAREIARADEDIALRKHHYGTGGENN